MLRSQPSPCTLKCNIIIETRVLWLIPGDGGCGSLPERGHALLLVYPGQGVEHAGVVPPLVRGQTPVRGHPDQRNLRRRAHEGANAASRHPKSRLHEEARRLALGGECLEEPGVDAESGGGVGGLAQQPGGQPVVEGRHALVLDDAGDDGGGARLGAARALADLHPVLDEVQRLHHAGGEHSGRAAEQELDGVGDLGGFTHDASTSLRILIM